MAEGFNSVVVMGVKDVRDEGTDQPAESVGTVGSHWGQTEAPNCRPESTRFRLTLGDSKHYPYALPLVSKRITVKIK